MKKDAYAQLELFSQVTPSSQEKKKKITSFLGKARSHEKIILAIIGFIVSCAVSFSLGRESSLWRHYEQPKTAKQSALIRQAEQNRDCFVASAARNNKALPEKTNNYTIQLASFQSKTAADREAQSIKKKGLTPLIMAKGKYNILCVGAFADKEDAKSLLTEVKRNYSDSYIRRL